jgi:hypothetical protein
VCRHGSSVPYSGTCGTGLQVLPLHLPVSWDDSNEAETEEVSPHPCVCTSAIQPRYFPGIWVQLQGWGCCWWWGCVEEKDRKQRLGFPVLRAWSYGMPSPSPVTAAKTGRKAIRPEASQMMWVTGLGGWCK